MRKIHVLSFISLDGIVQAPGGPNEDPSGGFKHGGWVFNYFDDFLGKVMVDQMSRKFDLLLGRKTYEIFAGHWPYADIEKDPIAAGINKARKFVVSNSLEKLEWENSYLIKGDVPEEINKLKHDDGPEIHIHGSGNLIQTLLKHDLIDEFWLKIFPITLGTGKRLFAEGSFPAGFKLDSGQISPGGIIVANYIRSGPVKTGSFAAEKPSKVELERREKILKEK